MWDYEVLDGVLLKQAVENGFRNFVYGPVTKQSTTIAGKKAWTG